jgi:hypothetical protein
MTKKEVTGWNNRVWDDQPCCWNCDCNGARWKQVGTHAYCGFSVWDAAGSTNKDGNNQMASYMLYTTSSTLRVGQGGPDIGYSEPNIQGGYQLVSQGATFFGVHLTETGADLLLDGVVIHSIVRGPADSQYRFGCATHPQNAGYTDLQYMYHFGSY